MIGLLGLLLTQNTLAGGVLYDSDGYAPLRDLQIEVAVDGRIATGTAWYTFDPVATPHTFAAPIPDAAAVSGLSIRLDGTWIASSAEPATGKAPGPDGDLDVLIGGDVFQVELPAGSAEPVEIELQWQAILAAEQGALNLEIPLSDGGLNPSDPTVTLSAEIAGNAPLTALTASLGIADPTTGLASATAPLSTLDAWTLSWTEPPLLFGIDVRTYRTGVDPFTGESDPDGYALVTLLPGPPDPTARVDALYTFAIDSSASMQGRPMQTAVASASRWLRGLDETDRFNLVPYTSIAVPFRGRAPLATESAVDRAIAFLERQKPSGLSDPTDGLVTGLTLLDDTIQGRGFFSCAGTAHPDGPPVRNPEITPVSGDPIRVAPYVVWITDGGASTGPTDRNAIAEAIRSANTVGASIFAVGVGGGVDRELLERIAGDHRGEVRYAERVGQVAEVVAELQDRIADPVLVRPSVAVPSSSLQVPQALPDVTSGTEVALAFRYADPGATTLTLRGLRGQEDLVDRFDVLLPGEDASTPAVARVWAQLRVADLDRRYLAGEHALAGEIEDLVRQYGVSSEVITLGFSGGSDPYVQGSQLASADSAAGCGCATPRGLAGGVPLGAIALLVLARRRM